ncbi:hypothetical protein JVT61DRAFT_7527 [Boletus reticuloceps]|uniref:Uncharacterized protein n=1 Tax=Boletus reticuloceps TaxID=495285 RepID=A0A8I2YI23_9AGAM|nr:hypothetical protein JVT61DRAFT_7527 [Boletus reticuloceps]
MSRGMPSVHNEAVRPHILTARKNEHVLLPHLAVRRWVRVELTTALQFTSAVRPPLFGLHSGLGSQLPEVREGSSQATGAPLDENQGAMVGGTASAENGPQAHHTQNHHNHNAQQEEGSSPSQTGPTTYPHDSTKKRS